MISEGQKLKAVLMLSDEYRSMWVRKPGPSTTSSDGRCLRQRLRYLNGWKVSRLECARSTSNASPSPGEPIPGPTLRARIGDLIQISFRNQVDTKNFPTSLDRGDCDEATGTLPDPNNESKTIKVNVYPRNNKMPNCVHGSSTSNLHFHGTHTTPSTTGDNVLLYIRPALRVKAEGKSEPQIQPTDAVVKEQFCQVFRRRARKTARRHNGNNFRRLGETNRNVSSSCTMQPRRTKGNRGVCRPHCSCGRKTKETSTRGEWPQYSVGAFPYCFRLPDYDGPRPRPRSRWVRPPAPIGTTPTYTARRL